MQTLNSTIILTTLSLPFPLDPFPSPMRELLEAITDAYSLHPASIALPMLTIAGSAIGNTRRLRLNDDHTVPTNIWSAILSPREDSRLPLACRVLLAPLIARQEDDTDHIHREHSQYVRELRSWQGSRAEFPKEPKPLAPRAEPRQYFFTDASYYHLPRYLARRPRGVLLIPGDLNLFFQSTPDQCLSLFDAPPFTFDHQPNPRARFAPFTFLSITGSISPSLLLNQAPNSTASRLASRFLLAASSQPPSLRPIPSINPEITSAWRDLITHLLNLEAHPFTGSIKPRIMSLDRRAVPELTATHQRLALAATEQSDPVLQTHLMNLIDYIPRLAMILQLATPPDQTSPEFLDAYSIASAAKLVHWFSEEAKRIHANLFTDSASQRILSAVTLIARHGGSITTRQFMQSARAFRHSADQARAFLQNLAKEGLGHFSYTSDHDQAKSPIFHLDPSVYGNTTPPGTAKNPTTVTTPDRNNNQR